VLGPPYSLLDPPVDALRVRHPGCSLRGRNCCCSDHLRWQGGREGTLAIHDAVVVLLQTAKEMVSAD
jgi:hypothetical protein